MKDFNYVDTDSAKVSEEMAKGIEKGLEIRAKRSLIAGAHNVDVKVNGETIRATHEVSELRKFSGDPLNGNYTAVYATTEDGIFLFVRVKEWSDVYSMEFGKMEDY